MSGKTVVITGAGSGIGRATAELLAAHGARIAALDLDENSVAQTVHELEGSGHFSIVCDVTSDEECASAGKEVISRFGAPSVLVNNAGFAEHSDFLETSLDQWRAIMDVNVYGAIRMSQAFLPAMREAKNGNVINVSSVAGQRGGRGFGGAHYTATKAALIGLTKSMAREFAEDGIRVNAVAPGFTETNIFKGRLDADTRKQMIAALPLGRGGQAEDTAGAMLYLASDLSGFVTGATIDVNGGGNMR
ncbi:SDR family oxidoreductase [Mesorhizobium sp.]|nr:SDR family oxidoreductase [Mesorhizobium sp.]